MLHINYIKQESKLAVSRISKPVVADEKAPRVASIRCKQLEDGVTINRVFVNGPDSGVFSGVGWVVNDNIDKCMMCATDFSFLTRKHHCRACGNLVCYKCSGNQSLIVGAEKLGQQRICNDCCSKEAASIALPITVLTTLDWGRPLGEPETSGKEEAATVTSEAVSGSEKVDPLDGETVDGSISLGPTEIHHVDLRTLSASAAIHAADEEHLTSPKKPIVKSASIASIGTDAAASSTEGDKEGETYIRAIRMGGFEDQKILITQAMMAFETDKLTPRLAVRELKEHAVNHPKMLLGWQITTDVDVKPETIYIVTDIRKNSAYKTEYKLVQVSPDFKVKEMWTLLKRSQTKVGIDFVPLRKVLYIGEADLTKGIDLTIKKRKSIIFN